MTASDPIKRPLRLSRRSADGPTAQVRNTVTTMLITIINSPDETTSGSRRNAGAPAGRLANFYQPMTNRRGAAGVAPKVEATTKNLRQHWLARSNKTKK